MHLPRWLKKLFFAAHPSAKTMLAYMCKGGLRALDTRSVETPAVMIFGCFDGQDVVFATFARHDAHPDLSGDLSQHLAAAAKRFLEEHA